jgi:DNA-binding NarL/FixJ family response regulator
MALRCVIVDDSARFLAASRALLEREGVDIVGVASTVADALRLVDEVRPDVTLVDIDLGVESGFELASRLAHNAGGSRPRTILISTHAESDFADLIDSSPATGFVSKSDLSAEALYAVLNESPKR